MSKHTPGPWEAIDTGGFPFNIRTTSDQVFVAALFTVRDETPANAKLIAAAPELLQALIDLGDWLAYGMNKADGAEPTAEDHAACERVAAQARAAIVKATGAA